MSAHRNKSGAQRFNVHYHHGYGGGAKRSKGILGADIDQKDFPDADFILRGHDHQKWHLPVTVDRITSMKLEQRTVHHLCLAHTRNLGTDTRVGPLRKTLPRHAWRLVGYHQTTQRLFQMDSKRGREKARTEPLARLGYGPGRSSNLSGEGRPQKVERKAHQGGAIDRSPLADT